MTKLNGIVVVKPKRKPTEKFNHTQVNAVIRKVLNQSNNYMWDALKDSQLQMKVNSDFWLALGLRHACDLMEMSFYNRDKRYRSDLGLIAVGEIKELNDTENCFGTDVFNTNKRVRNESTKPRGSHGVRKSRVQDV